MIIAAAAAIELYLCPHLNYLVRARVRYVMSSTIC